MACFLVTTAAAIGVGAARHIVAHKEKKNNVDKVELEDKIFSSKKLGYLELTLWGGAILLAGEHAFHEEITYKFPWLTAAGEGPEAVREMLFEMGTIGVAMLVILVGAWFGGVMLFRWLRNRKKKVATEEK